MKIASALLLVLASMASAFLVPSPAVVPSSSGSAVAARYQRTATTMMASDFNKARAARKPGPMDRVVELNKPLGIVLEEDEKGNVYVKELSPAGNAMRSGKVNKGDLVTMISATFGDEFWSARGAGLGMIMQAIKIRQGNSVKIVLEKSSKSAPAPKKVAAPKAAPVKPKAPKPDDATLLKQIEDEDKGRKKFFGLF